MIAQSGSGRCSLATEALHPYMWLDADYVVTSGRRSMFPAPWTVNAVSYKVVDSVYTFCVQVKRASRFSVPVVDGMRTTEPFA